MPPGKGRPFQKGNKIAKGGPRPGAGRPTDKYRESLRKIIQDPRVTKIARDILLRKDTEKELVGSPGLQTVVKVPVSADTWARVYEKVADRALGKPVSTLEADIHDSRNTKPTMTISTIVQAARQYEAEDKK